MEILLGILFIIAFISFVAPFVVWSWTNFNKAQEVFGVLRLKFILWTLLISWTIFIVDFATILLIILV